MKARVVTFSNILSSFATKEVTVIVVRFYPNRNVLTDFIKSLEYEIGFTLLLVDEQRERHNEVNMQFLQLFCESAYKFDWIHLAMNLTLVVYGRPI